MKAAAFFGGWRGSLPALRRHWRRLLPQALPWAAWLLVGIPLLWWEVGEAVQAPLRQARAAVVADAVQHLQRLLDRLGKDVVFLADLPARFPPQPGPAEPMDTPLAITFLSFSDRTQGYSKVRWLDRHGHERLRVNNDGAAVLVPPEQLQDKSERPFHTEAVGLGPRQVYLSALDLNVENDVIEQPLRPMLRAASPVLVDGERIGVVVINLEMRPVIERLRANAEAKGFSLYLVNPEGYWIAGEAAADEWGWQLGRPDRSLARQQPGLWRAMRGADQGEWKDWTFSSLRGRGADPASGADVWDVRVLARRSEANGGAWRWKAALVLVSLASAWIALGAVLGAARSMAAEADFIDELREANRALTESNERLGAMQAELARAERLSSLGLMVAGVAHEMNTPLGSALLALSNVRGDLALLRERMEAGLQRSQLASFVAETDAAIALATRELQRSAALLQRFKQVAVDRTSLQRRRFDLREAILDADPRLRRGDLGGRIVLELDLQPGLEMDSYPGPLEQVISNLLANALIHGHAPDAASVIRIEGHAEGPDHVVVAVSDDGAGVASQDLPRIFEPFYTTRRHAGGNGLGLHIVHQIVVEVLGGSIRVESEAIADGAEPGRHGTRFTLRIPRRGPAQ